MPNRRLSELDALVLLLLMQAPSHGYALLGRLPHVQPSRLYHSLHKLSGLGLVTKKEEAAFKAPVRTVYAVHPRSRGKALAAIESYLAQLEQEKERLVGALLSLIRLHKGYLLLKP